MTRRRSSLSITLVLIGAAALAGCGGDDEPVQRDVYTTLDNCQKDWGRPENCEPVSDGRYAGSYFYGPRYAGASYSSGRPKPSQHALDATRVARGGFGSSAALHASSGG